MAQYKVAIATQEKHNKLTEEMRFHYNMQKKYNDIVYMILFKVYIKPFIEPKKYVLE